MRIPVAYPRIAGASVGEAPTRVARTSQGGIRIKLLIFLNSGSGEQEITGLHRRIGNDFRHWRGSGANRPSISVHYTFHSRAAAHALQRVRRPSVDVGKIARAMHDATDFQSVLMHNVEHHVVAEH